MTDIVKRLRRNAGGMCISTPAEMEAADTIERLQDELDSWKGLAKQFSAELDTLKASVPELTDEMLARIDARAGRSFHRHMGSVRGQQVTPADDFNWHLVHATREELAAAPTPPSARADEMQAMAYLNEIQKIIGGGYPYPDVIERVRKQQAEKDHYIDAWSDMCDENQKLRNELDAEREKRWEGNRIAASEHAEEVRELRAELDAARRTAEYWKAEHLAGNAELDALKASVPERLTPDGKYGKQHHYAEGWNDCIDEMGQAPSVPDLDPLYKLLEYADESDGAQYGTLSTSLVRDLVNEALASAPKPGDKATARLIAAAPDLLAVVQELEQSAEYWSEYDVPLGIVDRLRAAIAKATGEPSKATAAWADVPNATQWLEELRGNTGEQT
jgi:hypothetical protein